MREQYQRAVRGRWEGGKGGRKGGMGLGRACDCDMWLWEAELWILHTVVQQVVLDSSV